MNTRYRTALVCATTATAALFASGCAMAKPACLAINAAAAACVVITVPTPDGGTEDIRMSRDELVLTARAVKAAGLPVRDGGVP